MSVQRIEKIESIIIKDPESPSGLNSLGFRTYYTHCIYTYSQIFYGDRKITFWAQNSEKASVELDRKIEDIDVYHNSMESHFRRIIIAFLSVHGQKASIAAIRKAEKSDGIIS